MKFLNFLSGAVLYSLSAFFISGCFLKQQPPNTTTQGAGQGKVEALMRLEETRGEASQSTFSATFAPEAKASRRVSAFRESFSVAALRKTLTRGETYCNAYKMPKALDSEDAENEDSDRATKYLNAGQLYFGQSPNVSEIPMQSNHKYYKELSTDLATGAYSAKVMGSNEVPAFDMGLSLPEALTNVVIDQSRFEDGVAFKKGGPLHLSWDSATLAKPEHIMLLEVYSDADPTYLYFIRCIAMESDTAKGGKQHWTIDPKYPGVLPATTKGELFLSRLLARQAANSVIQVETQGMQTHFTTITIE